MRRTGYQRRRTGVIERGQLSAYVRKSILTCLDEDATAKNETRSAVVERILESHYLARLHQEKP